MKPLAHLEIQYIKTDELLEYPSNAKLHPSDQIDQIAASIEEFNFNNPILAWHNDEGEPEIVAGHGRLMAARKLCLEELPVVFLDHMSEEQRRAYILVDNQLTMNSGFDIDILDEELARIDIDMADFGLDVSCQIDFEDFDGLGDGGGSRIANGTKVRVVIGPIICDIEDPDHACYDAARGLDPERVAEFIKGALLGGLMS